MVSFSFKNTHTAFKTKNRWILVQFLTYTYITFAAPVSAAREGHEAGWFRQHLGDIQLWLFLFHRLRLFYCRLLANKNKGSGIFTRSLVKKTVFFFISVGFMCFMRKKLTSNCRLLSDKVGYRGFTSKK